MLENIIVCISNFLEISEILIPAFSLCVNGGWEVILHTELRRPIVSLL